MGTKPLQQTIALELLASKKKLEKSCSSLYYSSLKGLVGITRVFLEIGTEANAQGGEHGNALQAASFRGFEKIVELLLNKAPR